MGRCRIASSRLLPWSCAAAWGPWLWPQPTRCQSWGSPAHGSSKYNHSSSSSSSNKHSSSRAQQSTAQHSTEQQSRAQQRKLAVVATLTCRFIVSCHAHKATVKGRCINCSHVFLGYSYCITTAAPSPPPGFTCQHTHLQSLGQQCFCCLGAACPLLSADGCQPQLRRLGVAVTRLWQYRTVQQGSRTGQYRAQQAVQVRTGGQYSGHQSTTLQQGETTNETALTCSSSALALPVLPCASSRATPLPPV
jgi:hypothetical protein